jgi:hypothetical protein
LLADGNWRLGIPQRDGARCILLEWYAPFCFVRDAQRRTGFQCLQPRKPGRLIQCLRDLRTLCFDFCKRAQLLGDRLIDGVGKRTVTKRASKRRQRDA